MFMVVLATVFTTLVLPNKANAKSVVCVHGGGCVYSLLSCEDREFEIYRKGGYRGSGTGVGCADYKIAGKPSGSVFLDRGNGGRPSITNDGKRIPIASVALESFLDSKMKEAKTIKKDDPSRKIFDEKFRKEFETLLSTDKGISEEGVIAMSRKLNIPIR